MDRFSSSFSSCSMVRSAMVATETTWDFSWDLSQVLTFLSDFSLEVLSV